MFISPQLNKLFNTPDDKEKRKLDFKRGMKGWEEKRGWAIIFSTYMWYKYVNRADYDSVRIWRYE